MAASVIFRCDGERPDMGCRAFYPTRSIIYEAAWREAQQHGWTLSFRKGRFVHLCPSRGHQEDRPACPQDPQHYLDSHAPGGAWYGVGHGGQESPW